MTIDLTCIRHRPTRENMKARLRWTKQTWRTLRTLSLRTTVSVLLPVGKANIAAFLAVIMRFTTTKDTKTGICFFSFPLDAKIKNRWLLAIKRQEHRDGFVVTAYTKICERHFRPEEIKKHLSGRKDLKDKPTIPSKISWNTSSTAFVRKSPKKRCLEVSFEQNENFKCEQGQENSSVAKPDTQICKECVHLRKVVEKLNSRACTLIKEKSDAEKENSELKDDIEKLKKQQFNSNNIRKQGDVFKLFTGLPPEKFDILFQFLSPGENANNLKYHEASKKVSDEPDKCKFKEGSKPSVSPKVDVMEQLFMFLVWLRCGFGQKHLAWLFGVGKSTVSRYLITRSNYLYISAKGASLYGHLRIRLLHPCQCVLRTVILQQDA